MRSFVLAAVLAVIPMWLFAARLTLRDGTVVYGQFVGGDSQSITFQDNRGMRRQFDVNQIQMLDFTPVSTGVNSGYPSQPSYPQPSQGSNRPYDNNGTNRAGDRYEHDWTVLPSGTNIAVRTDTSIDSRDAAAGATFPARIVQDVVDRSGMVVIPRGSEATLVVRQVNAGGTLSNGNFILDLDSVRANGRRYVVNSADLEAHDRSGIGANRRTGEMVGGGAVLGTLLGAAAGGGKGAAIGALAGAAAGGGVQVATKGKEIRVPAETVLNFRLEQPLHLREANQQ